MEMEEIAVPSNSKSSNVILPQKEWGEIDLSDIQDSTIPTIPLEHIFGTSFAKYLMDLSDASGTPVEYIVLSLLVLTSVIIGNRRHIDVRNGWTDEPTHLWGALVGDPSTRKTVAMRLMQKAIKNLSEKRRSEYESQKREYNKEMKKRAEELKKYKQDEMYEELKKPILRQLVVSDTTVEAVYIVINPEKPECFCLFRDELTGLFGKLDIREHEGDRSFFLEGYSSNAYVVNRVKFGGSIAIPKLSVSILGTIQPQKLEEVLKKADDGLLSRFLFAFSKAKISEEPKDIIDERKIGHIFEKIDDIPLKEERISLSPEAKEIFNKWHREHEIKTQRYTSGLLQSSYGKMGGQVVRLSCALEHIKWALSDETEPPQTISQDAVLKAIVLIEDYFKPMTEKVLVKHSHCRNNNQLLAFIRYLKDRKIQVFNVRDLRRKRKFPSLEEDEEKKFLSALIEVNIIASSGREGAGRPPKNYIVNPKLMEVNL